MLCFCPASFFMLVIYFINSWTISLWVILITFYIYPEVLHFLQYVVFKSGFAYCAKKKILSVLVCVLQWRNKLKSVFYEFNGILVFPPGSNSLEQSHTPISKPANGTTVTHRLFGLSVMVFCLYRNRSPLQARMGSAAVLSMATHPSEVYKLKGVTY